MKGYLLPHPIALRLEHLRERSMEPWARLSSSSLVCSAPERSWFSTYFSMTHFWTDRAAEPVALFADIVEITCGCFDEFLSMRVTTVASVTEQNNNKNDRRKQLLRTVFDRYVLVHPTTHPHDPSTTLRTNNYSRNAVADAYGGPPQKTRLPRRRKQCPPPASTTAAPRPLSRVAPVS